MIHIKFGDGQADFREYIILQQNNEEHIRFYFPVLLPMVTLVPFDFIPGSAPILSYTSMFRPSGGSDVKPTLHKTIFLQCIASDSVRRVMGFCGPSGIPGRCCGIFKWLAEYREYERFLPLPFTMSQTTPLRHRLGRVALFHWRIPGSVSRS